VLGRAKNVYINLVGKPIAILSFGMSIKRRIVESVYKEHSWIKLAQIGAPFRDLSLAALGIGILLPLCYVASNSSTDVPRWERTKNWVCQCGSFVVAGSWTRVRCENGISTCYPNTQILTIKGKWCFPACVQLYTYCEVRWGCNELRRMFGSKRSEVRGCWGQ
jgi:hypothetical protein